MGALAFAERLHTRLDTQRRLYTDFPRIMEQLRSGALERLAGSLSRLYEGGQGFDLQRFLRDLPLATAQLALAEAQARRGATKDAGAAKAATEAGAGKAQSPSTDAAAEMPTAAAAPEGAAAASTESVTATPTAAATESATAAPTAAATESVTATPTAAATESATATPTSAAATESATATPTAAATESATATPPAPEAAAEESGPVSPRLELRSKLLLAAPQLAKAAVGYRRNVATVRRAAAPRRSPGPWRSDREVLEEARRAAEFARQIFDAYAGAWADQPLTGDAEEGMAAEADRFLAWTQLNRYVELAVHGDPRHQKELQGRKVQPPPVAEVSASVAAADAAEPAAQQPEAPAETAASGEPAQ
jgi:hypothetical protein